MAGTVLRSVFESNAPVGAQAANPEQRAGTIDRLDSGDGSQSVGEGIPDPVPRRAIVVGTPRWGLGFESHARLRGSRRRHGVRRVPAMRVKRPRRDGTAGRPNGTRA